MSAINNNSAIASVSASVNNNDNQGENAMTGSINFAQLEVSDNLKGESHKESVLNGVPTVSCKIASCPDITMNNFLVLKGGSVYRKMISTFGKETVNNENFHVAYVRAPMTKDVAVKVILVSNKENAQRQFPLSGDRVYGSFFAMNYNMGDQDGDGISFHVVEYSDILNGNIELATMDGMFDYIENTIGYDMTSVAFFDNELPAQYFADHFQIVTAAAKQKKAGTKLGKSFMSWDKWNLNLRGAINQQTEFVGHSYKAQAHHTMLIELLAAIVKQSWCDDTTKRIWNECYSYAKDNEYAKYTVQTMYELALGGFDPTMAEVAVQFLLPAFNATESIPSIWDGTSVVSNYESKAQSISLGSFFGSSFTNLHAFKALPVAEMEDCFVSLGYDKKWAGIMLQQFAVAGFANLVNKAVAKHTPGNVPSETMLSFGLVASQAPGFALAIAAAQYVLSASQARPRVLLDYALKLVGAELQVGLESLAEDNIVAFLATNIALLNEAAVTPNTLSVDDIELVCRDFSSYLEDNKVSEEEVCIGVDADYPENLVTVEASDICLDEEELGSFLAEELAILQKYAALEETSQEEEEEELNFFDAATINLIQETVKPLVTFTNEKLDASHSLEVVPCVPTTATEEKVGRFAKTYVLSDGTKLIYAFDEEGFREAMETNANAFSFALSYSAYTNVGVEDKPAEAPVEVPADFIERYQVQLNTILDNLQDAPSILRRLADEIEKSLPTNAPSILSLPTVIDPKEDLNYDYSYLETKEVSIRTTEVAVVEEKAVEVAAPEPVAAPVETVVFGFKQKNAALKALSNEFNALCDFNIDGVKYRFHNVKAAYALQRLEDRNYSYIIKYTRTFGQNVANAALSDKSPVRADWNLVKKDILLDLLRVKFSKEVFKNYLLATGDAILVSETGDNLGEYLMIIREEIKAAALALV